MCLIVLAWQAHPRFDLLLAANRDEFHARPTEPAGWWTAPAGLFAGRDRQAGGAWCGADRQGRFAAVTNVREPGAPAGARSRGALVRDYFVGRSNASDWADHVSRRGSDYSPFNLLVGDRDGLYFVSNRRPGAPRRIRPGVVAVSNGHWGDHWPKTERAIQGLRQRLADDDIEPESLLELLHDTDRPAPAELPQTGIDPARERLLSPVFIRSADYGTRASTLIRRSPQTGVDFIEQGFDPAGQAVHRVHDNWLIETRST